MSYSTWQKAPPAPGGSVIRPPAQFLYAAIAAVVVSALLFVPTSAPLSVVGYLLAPFAATGAISLYRAIDIRRQASVWYVGSPGQRRLAAVTLVASFLIGALHAWIIATEIAKAFS